jgi:hypothetical protein
MKIKLIGHPGQVAQSGTTVIAVLESRLQPQVSTDLPEPPDMAVAYTVYMAEKQWQKVEAVLQNPASRLIVEGHCYYDAELKHLAVLAQNVNARPG